MLHDQQDGTFLVRKQLLCDQSDETFLDQQFVLSFVIMNTVYHLQMEVENKRLTLGGKRLDGGKARTNQIWDWLPID